MVNFTVAIPTYNGEHRLPEVLERLRSQINVEHLTWEVLVIDNNSSDQTAKVVRQYQTNFPCPVYYYLEKQQGAAFARKLAIQKAQSDLIGFLDDDNLPAPNWVAAAHAFAQQYPQAGAYGSRIQGEFEVEPSPDLKPILPFLAITERGLLPLRYEPAQRVLPPSAGLVVRQQAWIESVPAHTILGGRTGNSMLTGEDLEVLAHIQQAGWEIWYNPDMQIAHKIPHWRLERSYLLPFFRGIGLSRFVTRMVRVPPATRPVMLFLFLINDLRRIVLHLAKHRTQVWSDLAAACELTLLTHSLISPLYLYRKGYLQPHDAEQMT